MAYIFFVIQFGADYQVYYIVALLRHMQDGIKQQSWKFAVDELLLQNPIVNFNPLEWLGYMKELEAKYRKIIFLEMRSV